jgi:hypothetical protein
VRSIQNGYLWLVRTKSPGSRVLAHRLASDFSLQINSTTITKSKYRDLGKKITRPHKRKSQHERMRSDQPPRQVRQRGVEDEERRRSPGHSTRGVVVRELRLRTAVACLPLSLLLLLSPRTTQPTAQLAARRTAPLAAARRVRDGDEREEAKGAQEDKEGENEWTGPLNPAGLEGGALLDLAELEGGGSGSGSGGCVFFSFLSALRRDQGQ